MAALRNKSSRGGFSHFLSLFLKIIHFRVTDSDASACVDVCLRVGVRTLMDSGH